MIIAVDGPAASGKGTLAAGLARHYGLPHLDTGLLYRAVGRATAPVRGASLPTILFRATGTGAPTYPNLPEPFSAYTLQTELRSDNGI